MTQNETHYKWEKDLLTNHKNYSKCVAKLNKFKRSAGQNYAQKFALLIQTKDYWRQIQAYCSHFGCGTGIYNVNYWKGQHRCFASVVPALSDFTTDYNGDIGVNIWEYI